MKKIKRTITIRKVEFISNKQTDLESNIEICPLCHSQIPAIKSANNSAVDISAAEFPLQLSGNNELEGDKK